MCPISGRRRHREAQRAGRAAKHSQAIQGKVKREIEATGWVEKGAWKSFNSCCIILYRGVNKGLFVLLSRTRAGPGRTVKQEQEEISRNHVQSFIYLSVG